MRIVANKKAHPINQMSLQYVVILLIEACYLTYLPLLRRLKHGMELAPCPGFPGQVVKASLGHYPQPFLISIPVTGL